METEPLILKKRSAENDLSALSHVSDDAVRAEPMPVVRPETLGVPPGLSSPRGPAELLAVLAEDMDPLCRLVQLMGDEDTQEDDVIEWLATLASASNGVLPGRERAWLLRTVLKLLSGDYAAAPEIDLPLLQARAPDPTREVESIESVLRLQEALLDLEPATRASVLLVVHEGLSFDEAARVQGGSASALARRYMEGAASLGEDLIDVMLGSRLG